MARVLEDDIVFRFWTNFSELSFQSTDTEANSVSDLEQLLHFKTKENFDLSGNGFSLSCLSSLTQILICSLEW